MAIEIVVFPINSMVIFHSFLYVYQRVAFGKLTVTNIRSYRNRYFFLLDISKQHGG